MAAPTQTPAGSAALAALRNKLLDLSARNRLLHSPHQDRNPHLRIVGTSTEALHQRLLDEQELRFQPVPDPTREELIAAGHLVIDPHTGAEQGTQPNAADWASHKGLPRDYEVPAATVPYHGDQRLQTLLYPAALETRLGGLRARAETATAETGANICYVSFGFLKWFDTNANGQARYAPLVMIPIRIKQGRLNSQTKTYEYSITYTGEDILPNLTLKEKLRLNFGLELSDLDEDTRPEEYLADVAALIEQHQPTWKVHRWITICLLSFSKLLLYRDLDPANWPADKAITDHPLVRSLLGAAALPGDGQPGAVGLPVHRIDDLPAVHQDYPLIEDADSSQHSAIIDAVDGKNLVIEGPPGTGKSQTITNLIAAALSRGKRVLFVAEKLAALEVVKSKLEKAGLGVFCLELHGHKTQKRRVLDDIAARVSRQGTFQDATTLGAEITRYEGLKDKLRTHVERVNRSWRSTGFTIHQILTAATRYREALGLSPAQIHPEGLDGQCLTPTARQAAEETVRVLSNVHVTVRAQLGPDAILSDHPWYGVGNRQLMPFETDQVCSTLAAWQEALGALHGGLQALAMALGAGNEAAIWRVDGIAPLLQDLGGLSPLTGTGIAEALDSLHGDNLKALAEQLARLDAIRRSEQVLDHALADGWCATHDLPTQLADACAWFKGFGVRGDLGLSALVAAHNRLEQLRQLAQEIAEPVSEVARRLPPQAAALLRPTPNGLTVFRDLLVLSARLRGGLLQFRGGWCEDNALDDLLPDLETELTKLHKERAALVDYFTLEQLPAPDVLAGLRTTLHRRDPFCWFKRDWRAARRALLDLARPGDKPRLGRLLPVLDRLCRYAAAKARLEYNPTWRTALGPHFASLDTPIADLRELRIWYRAVRHRFGIGFGPQVALGDALIGLEPALVQGMQSLVKQGVSDRIDTLLGHIEALRAVFPNSGATLSDQTPLLGPTATIDTLRVALATHLSHCQTHLQDTNANLDVLVALVDHLHERNHLLRDWQGCTIAPAWFGGAIDLQVPPDRLTEATVATAVATLRLAQAVDCLQSEWLRQAIRRQPTAALFADLQTLSARLESDLATETIQREAFSALAAVAMDQWHEPAGEHLPQLLARNHRALSQPAWLANWLDYLRARDDLATHGFGRLAKAIDLGRIGCADAIAGFHLAVFDLLAQEILTQEPALRTFSGGQQNSFQEQFRECDERLKGLQRQRLAARIATSPVDPGKTGALAGNWTGLQLLKKECAKKTKHIPLRQLIDRAGEALVGLKPCFMMGPMSVAQYLKPGGIEFDLIVMDEASQLRPGDAIGAVARGKQLVVVGDPRQLPPTNFFQTILDGDDDGDDAPVVGTAESILDAALLWFPRRSLDWHYRSQHESLIAFSNHHFYDGRLVVFPSPNANTPEFGIQLTRVPEGRFVNQRNVAEANAVAEAVRAHLCATANASVGVVAMNAKQREQIERAVETLAKDDALFLDRLEANRGAKEPLFIKNLENVQGDERDLILISCTYGPHTPGGPVRQLFGPINQQTGWRRLNVLFTRAKQRMHLFASLGADDIRVEATSSRGVRAFHDVLAYADTGVLAQAKPTDRPPDSDFEIAVAAALEQAGFECVPQVGVAGFFIDLAVRDPGRPGRYLMGIECDGATYHSAKSVRDRDRLRQAILQGLGWRIERIWSTDWYKNPQAQLQPIVAKLNQLRTPAPVVADAVTPKDIPTDASVPIQEARNGGAPTVSPPRRAVSGTSRPPLQLSSIEPPCQLTLSLEEAPVVEEALVVETATAVTVADLRERLLQFNREVIRPAVRNTPEDRRLLRPAMIDALVAHRPLDQGEFLELIPSYLRQSIAPAEGHWLAEVLSIIESFE